MPRNRTLVISALAIAASLFAASLAPCRADLSSTVQSTVQNLLQLCQSDPASVYYFTCVGFQELGASASRGMDRAR